MVIRYFSMFTALLFCASSAAAQPGKTGQPQTAVFNGSLKAGLPQLRDGSYVRVHKIKVQPGVVYDFHLSSNAFDTFLWLQDRPQPIDVNHALIKDDDSGDGTNSRIRCSFKQAGAIYVVVNSFKGGETGNYTLRIRSHRLGAVAGTPTSSASRPPVTPPRGNVAGQIAGLRSRIHNLDTLIRKAEQNARECDEQARDASRGGRGSSAAIFRGQASAFRTQAAQFRRERAALQARLAQLSR